MKSLEEFEKQIPTKEERQKSEGITEIREEIEKIEDVKDFLQVHLDKDIMRCINASVYDIRIMSETIQFFIYEEFKNAKFPKEFREQSTLMILTTPLKLKDISEELVNMSKQYLQKYSNSENIVLSKRELYALFNMSRLASNYKGYCIQMLRLLNACILAYDEKEFFIHILNELNEIIDDDTIVGFISTTNDVAREMFIEFLKKESN